MHISPILSDTLPSTGVLFLGGHSNMLKKLRRKYPNWDYVSPEYFTRKKEFHQPVIFYWTAHSSHKLMRYVYARLDDISKIHFVSSTNTNLLLQEMSASLFSHSPS